MGLGVEGSCPGTTNASAGTLQADGGGVVVNEEDEKGRRKPVS